MIVPSVDCTRESVFLITDSDASTTAVLTVLDEDVAVTGG
ncbi:hypothetical protein bcere0016_54770 [Bacillus cereus 95/8201]|uniref:Uncharacterized protein n=1 Tax=Bacillus cereus TaxID=1396 RepID=A0A164N0L1_BACCE|nr:hypothetical protein bcere0016_54770 [Bacillus cereus 95/8201]EEL94421.1 hypothetical protein bcere0030_15200 [Bacillus cereus AH1273]KFL83734.1 hypothetical protein DJ51_5564 [Bacillus cereus]KKZ90612.1 hypothetical protein B4153_1523 [Bacillus cereus]KLA15223.1 hypothetical protein B4087_1511 [Bacillus cereus]